jgi:hypothetical protein
MAINFAKLPDWGRGACQCFDFTARNEATTGREAKKQLAAFVG